METCKSVPFTGGEYCYGAVQLSEYDVLFLIVIGAALVAVLVQQLYEEYHK